MSERTEKASLLDMIEENISESLRAQHPAIPWKNIAGMRDKLIQDKYNSAASKLGLEETFPNIENPTPVPLPPLRHSARRSRAA